MELARWLYANVLGNLVASAIWVWPLLAWHHVAMRRRFRRLHQHLDRTRA